MITNKVDLTQPAQLSEEEAKREVDIYLERIQQSFSRIDQYNERFETRQRENRARLDNINARIARL
jgi:hypothetical protein